jgi:transcriptional regulator with XRE-family HTH domain
MKHILPGNNSITAADILEDALRAKGWTQRRLALATNQSAQNINKKLSRNTIRAQEFLDILSYIGYEVKLFTGGEELKIRRRGTSDRVRKMVNGVIYDTAKSDALCKTLWTDGWQLELFRDEEGKYFVAHYTTWEDSVNHISPCTPETARKLYEQYGEGIPADAIFS